MMLTRWVVRNFKVISIKEAEELGLVFSSNVFGDKINTLNCRSLWFDHRGRMYRVKTPYYESEIFA